MSKQSKTGLTGSRKKVRRRRPVRAAKAAALDGLETPPKTSIVDCLDGLRDCLATITTLAGLLQASGGLLNPETANHAGTLLLAAAEKAGRWVDELDNPARWS